jgi:hypothetical protein
MSSKCLVESVYEITCDRCGVSRPPHGPDRLEWAQQWAQLNIYKTGSMARPPVDLCPPCLDIIEQQLIGASL